VLAGKVPMPEETAAYVPSVVGLHKRMSAGNTNTAAVPAADSLDAFLTGKGGNTAPKPDIAGSVVAPDAVDTFLMGKAGPASKPDTAPSPAEIPSPPGVAGVDDLGRPYPGAQSSPAQPAQTATPRILDAPPSAPTAPPGVAGVDDLGRPVPNASTPNQTPQPNAISRILGSAAQGAQEGFGDGPLGLNDAAKNALYPQGYAGGPAQAFNKLVIGGGAALGDLAMRAGGALYRGAQGAVAQTGAEVGQPQLGRDLASMPDAFMGSPGSIPGRVSAPASVVTDQVPAIADRVANQLQFARENDVQGPNRGAFLLNKLTDAIKGADAAPEPVPVTQGALMRITPPDGMPVGAVDGAPRPNSVGAAATPTEMANMAPREAQAYRNVAETNKLIEPQPIGRDTNRYVPGVEPTMAHMEQNANVSREAKMLESQIPEEAKTIAKEHNEARQAHFAQLAGSDVDVNNAIAARSAQAERDLTLTWGNKTEANPQPVMDVADQILKSPDGIRPVVKNAVKSVVDAMTDKDGNAITDPEMLYGVRKHIDDLLSKEAAADNPMNIRAAANLRAMKDSLDGVIEQAAPGFAKYRENFANASRPIDTMQALQKYEPKIIDSQGRIQLSRVQSMMKDIVNSRKSEGINEFKSIPDEAMNQLFALRDDLRRVASADELAKAKGSDTAQNFGDMAKGVLKAGGTAALHVGANALMPVAGSFVVNKLGDIRDNLNAKSAQRKMQVRASEMLRPSPANYPAPNRLD
jgi:hypothetical protein